MKNSGPHHNPSPSHLEAAPAGPPEPTTGAPANPSLSLAPPDRPIPSEGQILLRVRYCECDPMGVAHHSSCIPWFEMGRTELLRESGLTYAHMEAAGTYLVITKLEVRYRRPARYDDELALITRVAGGGRARIDHEYELWRWLGAPPEGRGKAELLSTASSTLACVDAHGRPRGLPDWLLPGSHVAPV